MLLKLVYSYATNSLSDEREIQVEQDNTTTTVVDEIDLEALIQQVFTKMNGTGIF